MAEASVVLPVARHAPGCRCVDCRPVWLERLVMQQEGQPVAHVGGGAAAGLVTWSITARVSTARLKTAAEQVADDRQGKIGSLLRRQWRPDFPSSAKVGAAVSAWSDAAAPWDGGEGARPLLYVGPGVISIRYRDLARSARTHERAVRRSAIDLELRKKTGQLGQPEPDVPPSREVTAWSSKSQRRMREVFAGLDWSPVQLLPWPPAMLTLTLPDDWQAVAPTGKDFKQLVRKFEKRWIRAWGFEPIWIWKLEFQRRGAPHQHMFAVLPPPSARAGDHRKLTADERRELGLQLQVRDRPAVGDGLHFREWLSLVWADVVAHPDPVQRAKHLKAGTGVDFGQASRLRDPARMSEYFTKHGSFRDKAYQNVVPEEWRGAGAGPGRFWGCKGLRKAVHGQTIDQEPALWAQRLLRRYSAAQGVTRQVVVPRYRNGEKWESKYPDIIGLAGAQLWQANRPRYRRCRRKVRRFQDSRGGFLCVNDGPRLAMQLVQAVAMVQRPPDRALACLPWLAAPAPSEARLNAGQRAKVRRRRDEMAEFRRWHPTFQSDLVQLPVEPVLADTPLVQLELLGAVPCSDAEELPEVEYEPLTMPSVLMPSVNSFDPDQLKLRRLVREFYQHGDA